MPSLFAPHALLPSGWERDVLLEWDDAGMLTKVVPGTEGGAAERAPGPVLPGMANVHSHAFQRAMAGLAEWRGHPTDDFWTWREAMYALVLRLEPEDLGAIAAHLYIEMLKHGYTAVGEFHYLHNDRDGRPYADPCAMAEPVVAAAAESGIALTFLPVLYAYGGFGHKPLAPAQRRFAGTPASIVELAREIARRHPRVRLGIAPHSVRAVDALLLTEMVEAGRSLDASLPVHMHVSEQVGEVSECIETQGVTPFAWIADIAAVDERWCLIHATHLTTLEMHRAGQRGVTIGLCPTTEANLGDGIFAFDRWFDERRHWGIGGDSHVSVSPFEELRALEYSQRLRSRLRNIAAHEDAPDVAANLWRGAAEGGMRAVGQSAGKLEAGARADWVVLDGADPDFEALDASPTLGVAIFSGNRNRVRDVAVGGSRVVTGGRHAAEERAADRYRAALARLRAR